MSTSQYIPGSPSDGTAFGSAPTPGGAPTPDGPVPPEPPKRGHGAAITVLIVLAGVIVGAIIAIVLLLTNGIDTSSAAPTPSMAQTTSSSSAKHSSGSTGHAPTASDTPATSTTPTAAATGGQTDPGDGSDTVIAGLTAGQSKLVNDLDTLALDANPSSGFDAYWDQARFVLPDTADMKEQAKGVFYAFSAFCASQGQGSDCYAWAVLGDTANVTASSASSITASMSGHWAMTTTPLTFTFSMKSTGSDTWEPTAITLTSP